VGEIAEAPHAGKPGVGRNVDAQRTTIGPRGCAASAQHLDDAVAGGS